MSEPRISIVVPVRNGIDTLPALFDALRRQRPPAPFEIVAVDSGSTDGTAALVAEAADHVLAVRPEAFNHGLTRNLGIEAARGELVVLIVQDAIPVGEGWLEALVAPFTHDHRLAGTFARQVPRAGASAIAKDALGRWVASGTAPRTASVDSRAAFEAMAPLDRLRHCAFDNVCSCIRRSVWARHRFVRTPIAEDLAWAREVLLAGYRLAYVPDAVVEHSHDRPLAYEYARTRALHGQLVELFGLRTIPSAAHLLRAVAATAVHHARCEGWRPAAMPRALGLSLVWPLAQFLGARDGVRRRQARGEAACAS